MDLSLKCWKFYPNLSTNCLPQIVEKNFTDQLEVDFVAETCQGKYTESLNCKEEIEQLFFHPLLPRLAFLTFLAQIGIRCWDL